MISAIVTHLTEARRLTATLASLAPAAIDGLVREALVVDVGADAETLAAAEDAGARVVAASGEDQGLTAALAAARGPWVLILTSGTRLQSGWEGVARRHIDRRPDEAGSFALALEDDGLAARAAEASANLAAGLLGRPQPRQGLLVPARGLELGASGIIHSDLVRRFNGRLRSLGARALS